MIKNKVKIKLIILFAVLNLITPKIFATFGDEIESGIQRYEDVKDDTEYEDINIVNKFMNMLLSYDKQYVAYNKSNYHNEFINFLVAKYF